MLAARTYKKELVLTATEAKGLPLTMSPYLHMKEMGMAHFIFMAMNEAECKQVGQVIHLTCAR
jgi:hypothetical protein